MAAITRRIGRLLAGVVVLSVLHAGAAPAQVVGGVYLVWIEASSSSVPVNTSMTLTVTSNNDVGGNLWYLVIVDTATDAVVASCADGTSCSGTVSSSTAQTRSYRGMVGTADGRSYDARTSVITVTWTASTGGTTPTTPPPTTETGFTVTLEASDTSVGLGDTVNLTATANQDVSATPYYIEIYDETGSLEESCPFGAVCNVSVVSSTPRVHSYVAFIQDYTLSDVQAVSEWVTVTWSEDEDGDPDPTPGTGDGDATRIAGVDRFATSALLSLEGFEPGVPVAYLATGLSFADALAGGAAAAAEGGPVLTTRRDSLPPDVAAELRRLQPAQVIVLGGPAAVSDAVASAASSMAGAPVTRVAGANRYSTAAAISERVFPSGVAAVFVATGASFADALSGGVAAAALGGPVLLVERGGIPTDTAAELERLAPARIYVLGSENVVGAEVLEQLRAFATDGVDRIAGVDRYATAAAVSAQTFGDNVDRLYLATGETFADALAGVALAGRTGSPMLLVRPTCVPVSVLTEIGRLAAGEIVIIGGTGSVGAAVASLTACTAAVGRVART